MTEAIRELAGLLEQRGIQVDGESSTEEWLVLADAPVTVSVDGDGLCIAVTQRFQTFSLKVNVGGQVRLEKVTGAGKDREPVDRAFASRGYRSEEDTEDPIERSNFVLSSVQVTYRKTVKTPTDALAEVQGVLPLLRT